MSQKPSVKSHGSSSSSLARAAGAVMALTLLSRLLGMIRDAVLSAHVGLTDRADIYTAAFRVPDLLNYLVTGGALASTFVPVFAEYLQRRDEKAAWKTFSVLLTILSIAGGILVIGMEVFAPAVVRLLNHGYTPQKVALTVSLTRILLPAQVFFLVGGLLMGAQNARGKFLVPAIGSCVYNLGSIVGLTLLYPWLGLAGGTWGAVAGAFMGCFALQWIALARQGMAYRPSFDMRYPGVVKVWKLMLPILLGVSLPNIDQIVSAAFASGLPAGSQYALTAANRIMLIPIGIFAQAAGIALLPALSRLAASGMKDQFRNTVNRGLGIVLFLTVPSSALLFLLAPEAIALFNQHGSFTAHDTLRASMPLRAYAVGIFAWSASALLNRSFYALQDTRTPVVAGTLTTAVFVVLSWAAVKMGWGTEGLAWSTSISVALQVVILYAALRIRLRGIRIAALSKSIGKTVASTAALCVAVAAVISVARLAGLGSTSITLLLAVCVAGTAAFAACAWILRMRELDTVRRVSFALARRVAGFSFR